MTVTARRPTIELALARAAAAQPGLTVAAASPFGAGDRAPRRRAALRACDRTARPVRDLVVDASGRRSRMPALLRAVGGPEVEEEAEDSGFVYYTRFFRRRTAPCRRRARR